MPFSSSPPAYFPGQQPLTSMRKQNMYLSLWKQVWDISMFFFFVFHTHTITRMVEAENANSFSLLLLLVKYYVAIAFLFFSRPKKSNVPWEKLIVLLQLQSINSRTFPKKLRKFFASTRIEMILEKSLGSKTKSRLYQLETIFTHRLDCQQIEIWCRNEKESNASPISGQSA